jgi:3-dehydroquinate dehydratase
MYMYGRDQEDHERRIREAENREKRAFTDEEIREAHKACFGDSSHVESEEFKKFKSNREKEIKDFIKKYGHHEVRNVLNKSFTIYKGM